MKVKQEYPKDLSGLWFGTLHVIGPVGGYKNENSMWRCECSCGHPNCKKTVDVRRGNLTRKTKWKLTCGAHSNNIAKTVKTKFDKGVVQKNSRTGIPGVNHSADYPGMYRARISVANKRITIDNLTFAEAKLVRYEWEKMIQNLSLLEKASQVEKCGEMQELRRMAMDAILKKRKESVCKNDIS